MRSSAVAVAMMLTTSVAGAQATAFTVPVSARESVRVKKCGRARRGARRAARIAGDHPVRRPAHAQCRRAPPLHRQAESRSHQGAREAEVPAILDDGTRGALTWSGSGLTELLDPPATTTSTSVPTSTSTTLPCVATDLGSTVPLTVAATTSGAGNHASPAAACFAFGVPPSNGEDVLYAWTAPANGTFVFDTLTPGIGTVLYAFAGCGGAELVCNDDFGITPSGHGAHRSAST